MYFSVFIPILLVFGLGGKIAGTISIRLLLAVAFSSPFLTITYNTLFSSVFIPIVLKIGLSIGVTCIVFLS
jgi:hypothetical protein